MDAVLLDTCVLLKSYLCDTLLSIAEVGTFRPLWSDHVLEELRRNLVKAGAKPEAVEHRLGQMAAFFPGKHSGRRRRVIAAGQVRAARPAAPPAARRHPRAPLTRKDLGRISSSGEFTL